MSTQIKRRRRLRFEDALNWRKAYAISAHDPRYRAGDLMAYWGTQRIPLCALRRYWERHQQ